MGLTKVTVNLPCLTGIARDTVKMDFIFGNATQTAGQLVANVTTPLTNFFNTTPGAPVSASDYVAKYIGQTVDRGTNKTRMDFYDLSAGGVGLTPVLPAGPPVGSQFFTLAARGSGAQDLPRESCAVLGFHGDFTGVSEFLGGTGRAHKGGSHPRSRLRGRVYIGPITMQATGTTSAGMPNLSTTMTQLLTVAAKKLRTDLAALATPVTWYVLSRKGVSVSSVVGFTCGDEIGIQRRRRTDKTTTASLSYP